MKLFQTISNYFSPEVIGSGGMVCVVGLGNPGDQYRLTRHNLGWMMLDILAERCGSSEFRKESRFSAMIAKANVGGLSIIFVKPQTFMNLSGQSVQSILHYYKLPVEDILVVSDDLDMDFGKVRFRKKGSHGGQNGLRDIFNKLGTSDIARIKIGISHDLRTKMPTAKFVLSKLNPEEQSQLPEIGRQVWDKFQQFLSGRG